MPTARPASRNTRDRGASAVEYGLLVAGIAVVMVAVIMGLGTFLHDSLQRTQGCLAGAGCSSTSSDGPARGRDQASAQALPSAPADLLPSGRAATEPVPTDPAVTPSPTEASPTAAADDRAPDTASGSVAPRELGQGFGTAALLAGAFLSGR